MLLILMPRSYQVYCCDPLNTPLHYREEIVSVIEAGFKMYLQETRPDRPIPKNLKIKQPKVSILNLSHISIF